MKKQDAYILEHILTQWQYMTCVHTKLISPFLSQGFWTCVNKCESYFETTDKHKTDRN